MITEIISLLAMVVLLFIIYSYRKEVRALKFMHQSLATRHGKMAEQFMPFIESYPYDKNNFRFIGTPVDGVQFEDDRIVFIEFKTGSSKFTTRQKSIKSLVEEGKIEFKELRI